MDYSNHVAGFTKLFSGIVHSTVWREEMHIKVVWITMLALADRNGRVLASMPGLADASRVSLAQCQEALARLSAPDQYSRTKEHEGRRIKEIDGGWELYNYLKYRNVRDDENRRQQVREAVGRYRKRRETVITGNPCKPGKAQAEAEAEAENGQRTPAPSARAIVPSKSSSWSSEACEDWIAAYNGTAPGGRIGKALLPLVTKHGWQAVRTAWRSYLSQTEAEYASPQRFAATFGRWSGSAPATAPASKAVRTEDRTRANLEAWIASKEGV